MANSIQDALAGGAADQLAAITAPPPLTGPPQMPPLGTAPDILTTPYSNFSPPPGPGDSLQTRQMPMPAPPDAISGAPGQGPTVRSRIKAALGDFLQSYSDSMYAELGQTPPHLIRAAQERQSMMDRERHITDTYNRALTAEQIKAGQYKREPGTVDIYPFGTLLNKIKPGTLPPELEDKFNNMSSAEFGQIGGKEALAALLGKEPDLTKGKHFDPERGVIIDNASGTATPVTMNNPLPPGQFGPLSPAGVLGPKPSSGNAFQGGDLGSHMNAMAFSKGFSGAEDWQKTDPRSYLAEQSAYEKQKIDQSVAAQNKNQRDETVEGYAKRMVNGDVLGVAQLSGMGAPELKARIMNRAADLYEQQIGKLPPGWLASMQGKLNTINDFYDTSKPKSSANQLRSFGTFLEHAGELKDAAGGVNLTNNKFANKSLNWWRANMKGTPAYGALLGALEPVRNEAATFLAGGYMPFQQDKESIRKLADEDTPVSVLLSSVGQLVRTAKDRITEMNFAHKRATSTPQNPGGQDIPDPFSPEAIVGAAKYGVKIGATGPGGGGNQPRQQFSASAWLAKNPDKANQLESKKAEAKKKGFEVVQ